MLTILFAAIKSTLSHLIPFLLRFWREILIVLMSLLYFNEKTAHEATTQACDTFKAELHSKAMQNALELKLKDDIHVKELGKLAKDYQANIEDLKLDRTKIQKGLQNEINRTGSLLNDVRVYQKRSSGSGLPKDESTAILSAEVTPDGYRAIIDACKLTTLDYNALYDAWMSHCDVYGCEK